MTAHPSAIPHVPAPRFYFVLALVFAFIAFAGFTPSYLAPVAAGEVDRAPILHLHAALFFAWTVLFVVQTRLAQSSLQTHRALGLAGISLATAMVFAGFIIIVRGLGLGEATGNEVAARTIAVVPVFAITTFAICVALAIANVGRPESHKRLMIMATVVLLPAAVARLLFALFAPPDAVLVEIGNPVSDLELLLPRLILPALIADALLIAGIVHDWRTRGRPHRVYVIGGLCIVISQALRPLVAQTDAWHGAMAALATLGR